MLTIYRVDSSALLCASNDKITKVCMWSVLLASHLHHSLIGGSPLWFGYLYSTLWWLVTMKEGVSDWDFGSAVE